MDRDEQAIRSLIAAWIEATGAGDTARVLELMAEDVVFLGAGRPPMRGRNEFAAAARASGQARIEPTSDIQEIRVFGEWAYCWNDLTVAIHPADGGAVRKMSGPALSVLRKTADGSWVIFRDANMVAPMTAPRQPEASS